MVVREREGDTNKRVANSPTGKGRGQRVGGFSGSLNTQRWTPKCIEEGTSGRESVPCRGDISDSECLEAGVGLGACGKERGTWWWGEAPRENGEARCLS